MTEPPRSDARSVGPRLTAATTGLPQRGLQTPADASSLPLAGVRWDVLCISAIGVATLILSSTLRATRTVLPSPANLGGTLTPEDPEEPKVAHKLAAIFAADIAGYSALMGADEESTFGDGSSAPLKCHFGGSGPKGGVGGPPGSPPSGGKGGQCSGGQSWHSRDQGTQGKLSPAARADCLLPTRLQRSP